MDNSILCPKATDVVNNLFTVFYAICNGFEKQFADIKKLKLAKAQWVIAFMEENINSWQQIEPAVSKCRKTSGLIYAPTVGDFLSWCKEVKQDKFLNNDQAYSAAYELMRNEPRQDLSQDQINILEHAIKASDRHFLKNNARHITAPVFHRNYEIALRDFINGDLKPIPKAIENKNVGHDPWKTMKAYGCFPEYAHLNSPDKALPVIYKLLEKINAKLPYDKHRRL